MMFAVPISTAQADWRWGNPTFKSRVYNDSCKTQKCFISTKRAAAVRHRVRVRLYHKNRLREWNMVTSSYIPRCTWYGESGQGPEYARYRYTLPNSTGSGAYGKFQFMPRTYFSRTKYGDWSPLDQEIAARREFRANGTSPWSNCH